jgi:hypothetical protein
MDVVVERLHSTPLDIARAETGEQSLSFSLDKIFEFLSLGEEAWRHEEPSSAKNLPSYVLKQTTETVAQRKARELLCSADIDEGAYWALIESDQSKMRLDENNGTAHNNTRLRSAHVFTSVFSSLVHEGVGNETKDSLGLNDFHVISHAGKGGFGDVVKVKMK